MLTLGKQMRFMDGLLDLCQEVGHSQTGLETSALGFCRPRTGLFWRPSAQSTDELTPNTRPFSTLCTRDEDLPA